MLACTVDRDLLTSPAPTTTQGWDELAARVKTQLPPTISIYLEPQERVGEVTLTLKLTQGLSALPWQPEPRPSLFYELVEPALTAAHPTAPEEPRVRIVTLRLAARRDLAYDQYLINAPADAPDSLFGGTIRPAVLFEWERRYVPVRRLLSLGNVALDHTISQEDREIMLLSVRLGLVPFTPGLTDQQRDRAEALRRGWTGTAADLLDEVSRTT